MIPYCLVNDSVDLGNLTNICWACNSLMRQKLLFCLQKELFAKQLTQRVSDCFWNGSRRHRCLMISLHTKWNLIEVTQQVFLFRPSSLFLLAISKI